MTSKTLRKLTKIIKKKCLPITEKNRFFLFYCFFKIADAFILVYSVLDSETFNRMDLIKKFIERQFGKEKKEVPIIVVGTMCDLPYRKVNTEFALNWALKEKGVVLKRLYIEYLVKLFEICVQDRLAIIDFVHFLSGKFFHPLSINFFVYLKNNHYTLFIKK